jgi:hypothetical protein
MPPVTAGSDPSGEPSTEPLHVAPPSAQPVVGGVAPDHSVPPAAIGSTPGDACPTCGSRMAPDQRYCLRCGQRRGDPRLPFMDAVVFMEAVKRPSPGEAAAAPPPPPSGESKSGISAQTTLIAGIATLLLAVGVGVLIGRSGNNPQPVAESPTKVIKIGGSESGGGEESEATTASESGKDAAKKSAKGSKSAKTSKAKEKSEAPELEEGENGGSKAAQEVLHTAPGVKEAKTGAAVGETCEKGTAGCSEGGEFNGSFFGE